MCVRAYVYKTDIQLKGKAKVIITKQYCEIDKKISDIMLAEFNI